MKHRVIKRPVIGVTCVTQPMAREGEMRHAIDRGYVEALVRAGAAPVLLSPALDAAAIEALLPSLDGVLLSGGGDVDPGRFGQKPHARLGRVEKDRDRLELSLARLARRAGLPVLGICRGVQVMNVAFGGTLVQDIPSQVESALLHDADLNSPPPTHPVSIEPGTKLRTLAAKARATVNSFHHQAIDSVAPGFRVSATAPDGVIEAIEATDAPFCLGVQWHPERSTRKSDKALATAIVAAFVDEAARGRSTTRRNGVTGTRSSRRAASPSGRR